MKFSELLQTLQADGDSADSDSADSMQWRAEVPESWAQGRTLFGGIQAAIGVAAMRKAVPADWPLRSLQVSFIAPVAPGAQRIQTRVLRTGKSAIHVEARLMDGDASGCFMLGIFGRGRDSAIRIAPPAPSQVVPVSASRALPFVAGVTPAFTRHLDFFWARGGFPFTGEHEAKTQVHVRLRDEAPVGELQIIALADSIPSPGLSLLARPAAASSLSWTLELLGGAYDPDPGRHWLMDATVDVAADGYMNQSAVLWTPDGQPAALSRQTVVVFA